MAIDFLDWCVRHEDALFIVAMMCLALKCIGDVIVAIDSGVQKYKARSSKP